MIQKPKMRNAREFLFMWKHELYASFLLSFVVFFVFPYSIYQNNNGSVFYYFSDVLFLVLGLLVVGFVLLAVISILISSYFYKNVAGMMAGIVACFWLQGNFLAAGLGRLNGVDWTGQQSFLLMDIIVWALLLSLAIFFKDRIEKQLPRILTALLILHAAPLPVNNVIQILARNRPEKHYLSKDSEFEFSARQNIVIILLDASRSDAFEQALLDNPAYKETFKDFTYYSNATSGYPLTRASVPSILSGIYNDNSTPVDEYLAETKEHSLPFLLKKEGYLVEYYSFFPYVYLDTWDNQDETLSWNDTLASARQLYFGGFIRYTPRSFTSSFMSLYFSGNYHWGHDLVELNEQAATVKKVDKPSIFKFYHLSGPHHPFMLDETLHLSPDANYLSQFEGSLFALDHLLNYMKVAGVYDNSLIFIIGDHGSTFLAEKDGLTLPHPMLLGWPLFLVKNINEQHDRVLMSDKPVSLLDVPKTIMDVAVPDNSLAGYSVFSDIPKNRARLFYYHQVDEPDWNLVYLPPLYEFTIAGPVTDPQSWYFTGKEFAEAGQQANVYYEYGTELIYKEKLLIDLFSLRIKDAKKSQPALCLNLSVHPTRSQLILSYKLANTSQDDMVDVFADGTLLKSVDLSDFSIVNFSIPNTLDDDGEILLCFDFGVSGASAPVQRFGSTVIGEKFTSLVISEVIK